MTSENSGVKVGDYVLASRWSNASWNDPWAVGFVTDIDTNIDNIATFAICDEKGSPVKAHRRWKHFRIIIKQQGAAILEAYPKMEGKIYYESVLVNLLKLSKNVEDPVLVLKTVDPYFHMVWNKIKLFELRKNDRNFAVDDIYYLAHYGAETESFLGRWIKVRITCVTETNHMLPGSVALGIEEIERGEVFELEVYPINNQPKPNPCPVCGTEPRVESADQEREGGVWANVSCSGSKDNPHYLSIAGIASYDAEDINASKTDAIRRWNQAFS